MENKERIWIPGLYVFIQGSRTYLEPAGGLIDAHFDAGPTDDHTVVVRGITYDVNYQAQPVEIEYRGVLRTLQVNFIGTKQ